LILESKGRRGAAYFIINYGNASAYFFCLRIQKAEGNALAG